MNLPVDKDEYLKSLKGEWHANRREIIWAWTLLPTFGIPAALEEKYTPEFHVHIARIVWHNNQLLHMVSTQKANDFLRKVRSTGLLK